METISLIISIIGASAGVVSAIVAVLTLKKANQILKNYDNRHSIQMNEGVAVDVNPGAIYVEQNRRE